MYGYKRARVDLDADTHESLRYFALLQGNNVGAIVRRVMAKYAAQVEKDFPPVRAHQLAWRQAMANQRVDPATAFKEWEHTVKGVELDDEVPF